LFFSSTQLLYRVNGQAGACNLPEYGTLRAMEHGTATVQIGAWIKALWILDRLEDLNGVLAQKESLLDQARAPRTRSRQRASRRA
jgi:hypothetical protein